MAAHPGKVASVHEAMHVRSTVRHSPETGCFVGAPALHLHQPSFSPSQLFVVQHQWKLSSHAVQYSWWLLQPLIVLSVHLRGNQNFTVRSR